MGFSVRGAGSAVCARGSKRQGVRSLYIERIYHFIEMNDFTNAGKSVAITGQGLALAALLATRTILGILAIPW